MSFSVEEVRWLIDHPATVAAADELPLTAATRVADLTTLRRLVESTTSDHSVELTRALAEFVTARRGAVRGAKIPVGEDGTVRHDWIVCSDSAQQATPTAVAAVRRAHLAQMASGAVIADVTCSVGSELAQLTGGGEGASPFDTVLGADLDPARLVMARHNLPEVPLVRADALVPAFRADVVVSDPARRTARGRIRDPRDLVPPLPDLVDVWTARGAELAVKCAPGIDYAEWEGQVDVVSVAGGAAGLRGMPGVKEACLYTPGLSRCSRRAVVVGPRSTVEMTSSEPESDAVASVGRYILDPDGAVVRAGLVRQYAARLGWWRIDPHIAYLSGDRVDPAALLPGQRVFEVVDAVVLKKLRGVLTTLGCGSLEILVRGVDLDPDALRRKLRSGGALRGSEALTVVVARVGRSSVAVVGRVI